MITDEQVRIALQTNAESHSGGRWSFSSPYTHSEEQALAITKACLLLGVPVDDILTSQTWCTVVERLVGLEQRLDVVEAR